MNRITPTELAMLFTVVEQDQAGALGDARRRLLPDHSLDVFVEVRFPQRERALVIASTEQIGEQELVLAAGLTCTFREGHVEVVAQPSTDPQVFCALLCDLLDHLQSTAASPAAAVARRIASWQRMLGRGLGAALGPEARIGLFGELLVLRDVVAPAYRGAAPGAWQGPRGAAKDFADAGWAIEVKTVAGFRPRLRCRIHGEHQLATDDLDLLALLHQVLRVEPAGMSLPDLVDELREHPLLATDRLTLENRLLEAGWLDDHRHLYDGERWVLSGRRCFRVDDSFPRLTPDMLPSGVSGVTYEVDLGLCAHCRIEESQLGGVLVAQYRQPGEATLVGE